MRDARHCRRLFRALSPSRRKRRRGFLLGRWIPKLGRHGRPRPARRRGPLRATTEKVMKRFAALAAILSISGIAEAQGIDEYTRFRRSSERIESPQDAAIEARFGRYVPNIDDEFDGATPFEDVYGRDNRYMLG